MNEFAPSAVFHRLSRLGQAISALRQGMPVRIAHDCTIIAAENITGANIPARAPEQCRLIFAGDGAQRTTLIQQSTARDWLERCHLTPDSATDKICFDLARQAEILPLLVVWQDAEDANIITIHPDDWAMRAEDEAAMIGHVLTTPVALADAEQSRIALFRVAGLGIEHLAILIGTPEQQEAPLVRVHSQCITGDLLGSLRCDCGPQLRGAVRQMGSAVRQMGQHDGGIILYMAHEGRAIGLSNKLRAYGLQDGGLDTVDANLALGYDIDNRDYRVAAAMLNRLGITKIKLLTNSPQKLQGLEQGGIEIVARVPHILGQNPHNHHYLQTKREKTGHLL